MFYSVQEQIVVTDEEIINKVTSISNEQITILFTMQLFDADTQLFEAMKKMSHICTRLPES